MASTDVWKHRVISTSKEPRDAVMQSSEGAAGTLLVM